MWSVWSAFILFTYANLLLTKFVDLRERRSLAAATGGDGPNEHSLTLEVEVYNADTLTTSVKNRKQAEQKKKPYIEPSWADRSPLKRSTRDLTSNDQNLRTAPPRSDGCTVGEDVCHNGGTCLPQRMNGGSGYQCLCSFGYGGPYCDTPLQIKYPKFDQVGSYIVMKPGISTTPNLTITVELKTATSAGLILYTNPNPQTQPSAFFSLTLTNRKLEFRFGLKNEIASVTTEEMLQKHRWYKVKIERIGRKGTIYIDDILANVEAKIFAKSVTTERTKNRLYLGGVPKHHSKFAQEMLIAQAGNGAEVGLIGCVKKLVMNDKNLDLRREPFVGDIIKGAGIKDCSDYKQCPKEKCGKGDCKLTGPNTYQCLCPKNASGDKCEKDFTLRMPRFTGKSYLKYTVLKRTSRSQTNLEVVFKPMSKTGLLLYSGYSRDRRGDFLAIILRKGVCEAYFDLGSGVARMKSRRTIKMNEWHRVLFHRRGRLGSLTVDDHPKIEALSPGENVQLTLRQDFFLGNHENYDHVSYFMPMKKGFKGCVQKLAVNGKFISLIDDAKQSVNVENCDHACSQRVNPCTEMGECMPIMNHYNCSCQLSLMGRHCETKMDTEDITYPQFYGQSYILFNNSQIMKKISKPKMTLSMTVHLREQKNKGVLVFLGANMENYSRYILLKIVNNKIVVYINDGLAEAVTMNNFGNILGNRDYIITLKRKPNIARKRDEYSILLDKTAVMTVNQPRDPRLPPYPQLLIGGVDKNTAARLSLAGNSGITGCIKQIQLETDDGVEMLRVSDADGGRSIGQCKKGKSRTRT